MSELEICELNGYRYYLGPEAPNKMKWDDAKKWCDDQGYELPSREVMIQCYRKFKDQFKTDYWYWIGDEFNATYAWKQDFGDGFQFNYGYKDYGTYVMAVRKVPNAKG